MKLKSIKNFRTLHIYTQLCEGKVINKWKEATRFGVNERTIQRDITKLNSNKCKNETFMLPSVNRFNVKFSNPNVNKEIKIINSDIGKRDRILWKIIRS